MIYKIPGDFVSIFCITSKEISFSKNKKVNRLYSSGEEGEKWEEEDRDPLCISLRDDCIWCEK